MTMLLTAGLICDYHIQIQMHCREMTDFEEKNVSVVDLSKRKTADAMNDSFVAPPPFPGPGGPPPPAPIITNIQSYLALIGYVSLFILGTFGHTSSFLIFSRPILRPISTSCLFIALTVSDSVYLLFSIYDFINTGLQIRDASINVSNMCRFRNFIQWTAMCCNAWLLVTIAVDRWIRVRFSWKCKQICTRKNAFIVTILIVIVCAGFNAHVLGPSYTQLPAGVMTVCGPSPSNAVYNRFFREIWPVLFSAIQTLIPVLLLMIFSLDTFRRLVQQRRIQDSAHARRRSQLDNQMILIMLATIALFVTTTLPLGLFNILLSPVLRRSLSQTQALQFSSIVTFIVAINYTLDFYIHCLTSRLFRREIWRILQCQKGSSQMDTTGGTGRTNVTGMALTQIQTR